MKRSPNPVICAILSGLLLCIILVPVVSAANPPSATPSATVPPVLLACSRATNPEANFTCGFSGDPSPVIPDASPYTIKCIDNSSAGASQSIVSWKWDFGDGGSSTDQNPRHTYSEAGRYDIRLTVSTLCGSQYSNTTFMSVPVYCSMPQPAFTTNVSEGDVPLAVEVTDGSLRTPQDITRWTYWFDNTHISHDRNPVFIYTTPGIYIINQTVRKDCVQPGSNSYPPATRQIRVNPPSTASSPVNETNTTPKITATGAVPVGTTPAGTEPVLVAATETTLNVPAVPGTGTLNVNTEPAGAKIFIDDILRGTSPTTVADLSAGSHTIRLEREGYYNMTVPVGITGGKTTEFSTSLTASGSTGIALLPLIALILIIVGVVVGGIYLFLKQRAEAAWEKS
jgi:PKD repeat protein